MEGVVLDIFWALNLIFQGNEVYYKKRLKKEGIS